MTPEQIEETIRGGFPDDPDAARIKVLGTDPMTLVLPFNAGMLRPGGTLSGPTLMKMADTAMWAAAMHVCDTSEGLFTSSLHIDFLRLPAASDLIAVARVLKPGRRLVVGTVELRSRGDDRVVAHASVTYARA
ncbi:MAG: PaaI family thioesterase [bacterium]